MYQLQLPVLCHKAVLGKSMESMAKSAQVLCLTGSRAQQASFVKIRTVVALQMNSARMLEA